MPKTKAKASHPEGKPKPLNPLKLQLDSHNPRLTKEQEGSSQPDLLKIMIEEFKVEEIAESIIATGYLPFDPLIGWEHDGVTTILEGNRRIAAIQLLLDPALAPEKYRKTWTALSRELPTEERRLLENLEVKVFPDRGAIDVRAYIGFRHVTGPLKWPAHEKASFIAQLVEQDGWTYEQIAERLGSYPKLVERHYVAHQVVRQAREEEVPGSQEMENAFGVLLRALQTRDIVAFLGLSYPDDPKKSRKPVPQNRFDNLKRFVEWTFGVKGEKAPLLTDSRQLTKWGRILQSDAAVRYLKTTPAQQVGTRAFERAWFKSGGQVESLQGALDAAADRLEEGVPIVSEHKEDPDVKEAVRRCTLFLVQILRYFPDIQNKYGLKQDV
jgi:hypothetical protein